MNKYILIFSGVILPFIGTTLGAMTVFFIKFRNNNSLQKFLSGTAAGVMTAASVWSLLIPSAEMAEKNGGLPYIPAVIGFISGMLFLLFLDRLTIRLKPKRIKLSRLGSCAMLFSAVTLHNIPEGMAVGVAFAGAFTENAAVTVAGAFALSLGITIQNFPEGAVISMPLAGKGMKNRRAFFYGFISGAVEPVGALITLVMTSLIVPVLPYMLSFAGGAMIYVVFEELAPEITEGKNLSPGALGVTLGFSLMMLLDMAL
ncbi:MAG: ZIP family metal transporter [Clostridiales bacterium]|nr:ZIP family metal transporter [Clostridiales bacterium]